MKTGERIVKNITKVVFLAALAASATAALAQGADTYKAKCQMCHGADGSASSPAGKAMKVPALATFAKESQADLIAITKNGKGKMPAYAGKLTDPQIKDVVVYMVSLK
jgi:mono/diheme cytochrome c family protein